MRLRLNGCGVRSRIEGSSLRALRCQTESRRNKNKRHSAHLDDVAESLDWFLSHVPIEVQGEAARVAMLDVFRRPAEFFGTAGLVFAGYGDHDVFPRMIEYQSAGMLEGTQVIHEVRRETIDH